MGLWHTTRQHVRGVPWEAARLPSSPWHREAERESLAALPAPRPPKDGTGKARAGCQREAQLGSFALCKSAEPGDVQGHVPFEHAALSPR